MKDSLRNYRPTLWAFYLTWCCVSPYLFLLITGRSLEVPELICLIGFNIVWWVALNNYIAKDENE